MKKETFIRRITAILKEWGEIATSGYIPSPYVTVEGKEYLVERFNLDDMDVTSFEDENSVVPIFDCIGYDELTEKELSEVLSLLKEYDEILWKEFQKTKDYNY